VLGSDRKSDRVKSSPSDQLDMIMVVLFNSGYATFTYQNTRLIWTCGQVTCTC